MRFLFDLLREEGSGDGLGDSGGGIVGGTQDVGDDLIGEAGAGEQGTTPPAPQKFTLGGVEFESEAAAAEAYHRAQARLSEYDNSVQVQQARQREAAEQAQAAEAQRQMFGALQEIAKDARADIEAGNVELGFAKLMKYGAQSAQYEIMQKLPGIVGEMIRANMAVHNSGSDFRGDPALADIHHLEPEAMALERAGVGRAEIVQILRGMAKRVAPPQQKQRNSGRYDSPDSLPEDEGLSESDRARVDSASKNFKKDWQGVFGGPAFKR